MLHVSFFTYFALLLHIHIWCDLYHMHATYMDSMHDCETLLFTICFIFCTKKLAKYMLFFHFVAFVFYM